MYVYYIFIFVFNFPSSFLSVSVTFFPYNHLEHLVFPLSTSL